MTLGNTIDHHDPDSVAVVDGELTLSYGELRQRVDAMRAALHDAGHGPGDRIVVACGNEAHFVTALLAVAGIGAVAAPINPYGPPPELERKVATLQPALVVAGAVVPWLAAEATFGGVPVIAMDAVPTVAAAAPPAVHNADDDVAVLLSTSGVSGVPKVAQLTHGNLGWIQGAIAAGGPEDVRSDDVVLAALPVAHVLGLNVVVLATLRAGAAVVFQRRFDVPGSIDLIAEHGVTMLIGAPPMWRRWSVAEAPDGAMETVRFARSGAAALPPLVADQFLDKYGIEIRQGYGLTETASVVTTGRGTGAPRGSVGRPLPGIEVVLVDEAGDPVDKGDIGEIVIRSPGVFAGYLDDTEASEAILSPDGWLWTGDVGVYDDDGFLYLVDRVKDIIIVSGFNVYPAEVEDVLMMHPDVRGAVVVGGEHAETGEAVVAHVAGEVDIDELDRFVRSHLSSYKVPSQYHVVDELPVAETGKAVRRELRA